MIEPDADKKNADWPKRTDDRTETLEKGARAEQERRKAGGAPGEQAGEADRPKPD